MKREFFNMGRMRAETDKFVQDVLAIKENSEFYPFLRDIVLIQMRMEGLKRYYKEKNENIEDDAPFEIREKMQDSEVYLSNVLIPASRSILESRCKYFKKYKLINKDGINQGLSDEKIVPDAIREKTGVNFYLNTSSDVCQEMNGEINQIINKINEMEREGKQDIDVEEELEKIEKALKDIKQLDEGKLPVMEQNTFFWSKLPPEANLHDSHTEAAKPQTSAIFDTGRVTQMHPSYVPYVKTKKGKKRINVSYLKKQLNRMKQSISRNKKEIIKGFAIGAIGLTIVTHAPEIVNTVRNIFIEKPKIENKEVVPKLSDCIQEIDKIRPAAIHSLASSLRSQGFQGNVTDKELLTTFLDRMEDSYKTNKDKELYTEIFCQMIDHNIRTVVANAMNEAWFEYKEKKLTREDIEVGYQCDNGDYGIYYKINGKKELIADNDFVGGKSRPIPRQMRDMMEGVNSLRKEDSLENLEKAVENMKEYSQERYTTLDAPSHELLTLTKLSNYSSVKIQYGFNYEIWRNDLESRGFRRVDSILYWPKETNEIEGKGMEEGR